MSKITHQELDSSLSDEIKASTDKLKGIEDGANHYVHPSTHPASMITLEDENNLLESNEVQGAVLELAQKIANGGNAYELTDGANVWDTTNVIDPNQDGLNIDQLFDSKFYWGSETWGTRGTLPTDNLFFLIAMNAGGYSKVPFQIAFVPSINSENDNAQMFQRRWLFDKWLPWKEFKVNMPNLSPSIELYDFYVDGKLGTDSPEKGKTSGEGAYKTIQYAINQLPHINGSTRTIRIADGVYDENVKIKYFIGGNLNIIGTTRDKVSISSIEATYSDHIVIRNINLKTYLTLMNVKYADISDLYINDTSGVIGITFNAVINGKISNVSCANKSTGLYSISSDITLGSLVGTGNTTGIRCDASTIRKSSSTTITGTTPQTVVNGGQILT